MSPPRLAVAAAAALFSSGVSFGPQPPARRPPVSPPPERPAAILPEMKPLDPIGPLPSDMQIEVTPERSGHQVTLRRKGHLVALHYGAARAGGVDRASVTIAADTRAAGQIAWEATKLGTLVTDRGFLSIHVEGASLRVEGSLAAPPEPIAASRSAHHDCSAHRDTTGGFAVLCLLPKEAVVAAANVTGHEALQDVWVAPGKSPLVRVDFPIAPGMAEGKVITSLRGQRLSVLRVETIWPEGEEPSISFHRDEREQPAAPIGWR